MSGSSPAGLKRLNDAFPKVVAAVRDTLPAATEDLLASLPATSLIVGSPHTADAEEARARQGHCRSAGQGRR